MYPDTPTRFGLPQPGDPDPCTEGAERVRRRALRPSAPTASGPDLEGLNAPSTGSRSSNRGRSPPRVAPAFGRASASSFAHRAVATRTCCPPSTWPGNFPLSARRPGTRSIRLVLAGGHARVIQPRSRSPSSWTGRCSRATARQAVAGHPPGLIKRSWKRAGRPGGPGRCLLLRAGQPRAGVYVPRFYGTWTNLPDRADSGGSAPSRSGGPVHRPQAQPLNGPGTSGRTRARPAGPRWPSPCTSGSAWRSSAAAPRWLPVSARPGMITPPGS